jgi:hypothetical protein
VLDLRKKFKKMKWIARFEKECTEIVFSLKSSKNFRLGLISKLSHTSNQEKNLTYSNVMFSLYQSTSMAVT